MDDPNDIFTTKRTINHRTKQIETRIRRQIVIEDGKVISDTGPLVTTKTLEDKKEEIDEIEHKYAFGVGSSRVGGPHWKASSNDTQPEQKGNQTPPLKTYIFGESEHTTKNSQEKMCREFSKFQNHNHRNQPKTSTPNKYFYFGQNSNDIDCKEKENQQQQINSTPGTHKTKLSKLAKETTTGHRSSDASEEEKNCQFVYEYSDFSHHCPDEA